MWVLKLISNAEEKNVYLTVGKPKLSFGRINTDVVLQGDSSISRLHCTLRVAAKDSDSSDVKTTVGLWVVDCESKYGTFVQGADKQFNRIEPNASQVLEHGSVIRFGVLENIWSVEYCPITVCTSVLTSEEKNEVRTKLQTLGGDIISNWDSSCSYLVAGTLRLTEKTLMALIYGVPIVTPKFIDNVVTAVKNNEKFPDLKQFRPNWTETAVRVEDVNLNPGFQRRELFKGKKFYVENEELVQDFKVLIEAAGGSISIISSKIKDKLLEDGAVLLDTPHDQLSSICDDSQAFSEASCELKKFVEENNRRVIPSREIALAIAYASVTRLCNACHNDYPFGLVAVPKDPINFSQYTLLQEDSAPLESNPPVSCFVAESEKQLGDSWRDSGASNSARKRGPSDDIFEESSSKRRQISSSVQSRGFNATPANILDSLRDNASSISSPVNSFKRKAEPCSESLKKMKIRDEFYSDEFQSVPEKVKTPEPTSPAEWIDMSNRKDPIKTPSSNPLTDTIIMLSLVTLAQHFRVPVNDPRNVKVFSKQNVADTNRTVDLESQKELRDDWTHGGR